jgi:hypothetical protein
MTDSYTRWHGRRPDRERDRILADILPQAVRVGVCTDEDDRDADEDREIHPGIRWDYPAIFQKPEE